MNPPAHHFATWTLLALAVLFGHDAIMAAEPHNVPMATAAHSPASHDADHHEAPAASCHTTEGAWLASVSPVQPGDVAVTNAWTDTGDASQGLGPGWWATPPGRPPDVLRALLQVFLN